MEVELLFNDRNETLVKKKEASQSTLVNLPPEASTMPYHSITLHETFDLEDLELPNSSFFMAILWIIMFYHLFMLYLEGL